MRMHRQLQEETGLPAGNIYMYIYAYKYLVLASTDIHVCIRTATSKVRVGGGDVLPVHIQIVVLPLLSENDWDS